MFSRNWMSTGMFIIRIGLLRIKAQYFFLFIVINTGGRFKF